MRKWLLGALLALFIPSAAFAQAQIGSGQVWGNSTAARAPGKAENLTAIIDRAFGSSPGAMIQRGASNWGAVGPFTGLLLGNGASALTAYAGTSCTNQFPRSLNASGAATCASVANTDLVNSSLTIGSTTIALGATSTSLAGLTTVAYTTSITGTSSNAAALAIGQNGATNPAFQVDASTASQASGLKVTGAAAGAPVNIAVIDSASNTSVNMNAKGSGIVSLGNSSTGGVNLAGGGGGVAITGPVTNTSANSAALTVGPNGATNPVLQVDASVASQASGLKITGGLAAGNTLVAAISSGAAVGLSLDAKGAGGVHIGATSTGGVDLGNGGGGVSATALTVTSSFTATGLVGYAALASAAIATSSQYFTGTSSVLVQAGVIYQAETTTTFGSTTTFDFNTFINTAVTLTANITTQTLSNVKAGQAGQIRFIQDGTGSRTTVWNSIFKFSGGTTPTLTTTANAIDVLFYSCVSASLCYASLIANMK